MKYMVSYALPASTYNEAVARFLAAGGLPPAGVNLIGRWHGMSGKGFAVAEWSDVIPLEVTPCLDDAEAGEVLQAVKG